MTRLLLVLGLVALPVAASAQQAETIEYYGTDAIGSIRIVWDASGNVIARQDFTPFGEPVLQQGTAIPKEGFGGNETDAETNQDYFHARMFEARTGRFSRPDPIEGGVSEPQTWNMYAYALNNPSIMVDPFGTEPSVDCWLEHICAPDPPDPTTPTPGPGPGRCPKFAGGPCGPPPQVIHPQPPKKPTPSDPPTTPPCDPKDPKCKPPCDPKDPRCSSPLPPTPVHGLWTYGHWCGLAYFLVKK